jgi:membrane protease YdiL (CAAX protease family)
MDDLSAPEKRSPEPSAFIRPPGLEMAMGLAIFTFCLTAFHGMQVILFIRRVMANTPELAGRAFSFDILQEDIFETRWAELSANGDAIAQVSFWSGLIGLALVLLMTWRWKRGRTPTFLALAPAPPREFLKWTVVFLSIFLVLEVIGHLLPDAGNDFMAKVLGSSTNKLLLLLGVGVMPALFEEFLLRGLLYGSLRHVMEHHIAIAIVAGLFTMLHMQYEWYVLLLIVLPMGVALGYARANGGSIWVPVLLHLLNNCASILLPDIWS